MDARPPAVADVVADVVHTSVVVSASAGNGDNDDDDVHHTIHYIISLTFSFGRIVIIRYSDEAPCFVPIDPFYYSLIETLTHGSRFLLGRCTFVSNISSTAGAPLQ